MFGEILKKLRIGKNMTQQELAKILKISSSTIGMYEQNRRSPDIETLKMIANYFQCSTDYLLDKNSLGARIRSLREEKSISQLELAKILNIGNTTLSQYESDKRIPSDTVKKKIADYFNVSTDYLLGRSNIRNPYIKKDSSETDEVDELEQEFEELKDKMKNISPSKRKKILKMIELFEEDEYEE